MGDAIDKWLEVISCFSMSENNTDTRQTAAEALSDILPFLTSHPCVTGRRIIIVICTFEGLCVGRGEMLLMCTF